MTNFLKVALAASSVAALAAWIRHAYRPRVKEAADDFSELTKREPTGIDIDDDTAAEIIRRARPQLERAREIAAEGY
jgi:hypothetical protein